MSDWPMWTLEEANALLPHVIALTHRAVLRLQVLEARWGGLPFRAYDALRGAPCDDLIRADWARDVSSLGAQPQAYFAVAFQSIEPEVLLSWAYGEVEITHQVSAWETVHERQPIQNFDTFRLRDFDSGI
jgi:hypothetical protein